MQNSIEEGGCTWMEKECTGSCRNAQEQDGATQDSLALMDTVTVCMDACTNDQLWCQAKATTATTTAAATTATTAAATTTTTAALSCMCAESAAYKQDWRATACGETRVLQCPSPLAGTITRRCHVGTTTLHGEWGSPDTVR